MTNATTRANATGLPSRRRILATLAGVGTALALPVAVQAAIPADSPDAALIALAGRVETLVAREQAAGVRYCDANHAADQMIRHRPKAPREEDFPSLVTMEEALDGTKIVRVPPKNAYAARDAAKAEYAAAVDAWEAEREAVEAKHGEPAAGRLWNRTQQRLFRAAQDLEAMTSTTHEGVVAKAKASVAVLATAYDTDPEEWMVELMASTLRDVVAIGGVA